MTHRGLLVICARYWAFVVNVSSTLRRCCYVAGVVTVALASCGNPENFAVTRGRLRCSGGYFCMQDAPRVVSVTLAGVTLAWGDATLGDHDAPVAGFVVGWTCEGETRSPDDGTTLFVQGCGLRCVYGPIAICVMYTGLLLKVVGHVPWQMATFALV